MVDPAISSQSNKPIFFIDLSGQHSNPMIPDSYISTHLKGKTQSTKLKLNSDASDRAWEVQLDAHRFAEGWKEFCVHHCIQNDDILSFRHDGDMVLHVTPFGRSFSHQIQFISSTSDDENDDDEPNIFDDDDDDDDADDDEDDDDEADVGDGDDFWTSEEDLHLKKTSSKKRARTETESLSEKSYLIAHVTSSGLRRNHMCLSNNFAKSNGLNNRQCEIDLMNEDGESWTLDLKHNKTTGQAYICRGWTTFCKGNGIKAESFCRFKFVQSGTKPVLQLCPKANEKRNLSETEGDGIESDDCSEAALMKQNMIVTLELKPYMLKSGQIRLPASFTRDNGINEAGKITVVNEDGIEWRLHLGHIKGRGQFYVRGFKDCFLANGIKKVGDSFTFEFIRGGATPVFKICSKIKEASFDGYKTPERRPPRTVQASRAVEEMETQVQKRARVSAEGGPSHHTRASHKLSADPGNLQHKQPLQPCSISDQVKKVKQSIVDTLTDVRRFRSELEIKEQNLETSLLEIDALEEKIMGIGKFFNINQV